MPRFLVFLLFLDTFFLRVEPSAGLEPGSRPPRLLATGEVTAELAGVPGVRVQAANNNLDVIRHEGRTYLAFRSAPDHFANVEARLEVVSSADEHHWVHETTVALGSDLREPRLLSWRGELILHFAVLGRRRLHFEPRGMMAVRRTAAGSWTAPRDVYRPGFIPWRTKVMGGIPYMMAYGDGRHIYERDGVPLQVHWLTTEDGTTWQPVVPGHAAVMEGGGSEADFVVRADGSVIAVARNEAGDASGWGSKICRGEAAAPADWRCITDPRKLDSPLLFEHGGRVYLVARRHLSGTGAYDLHQRWLSDRLQTLTYQLDYWRYPKRCAVWEVDPQSLEVHWLIDLPSRGDTCFPAVLNEDQDMVAIYNYSTPLDAPDIPWVVGQLGPTRIYRSVLDLH
jgi:hypothetical protein